MRIGTGFDAHAFAPGRDLILGGKKIDFPKGLSGHSDADVLIHAIIDSLLGAAGLGDIGKLFPDSDSRYRGISSMRLLDEVAKILRSHTITIINIDSVVICQEPKISSHTDDMKSNLSRALGIEASRISIKGKSTEGIGFTGRGEGIAAIATALLRL
ncbi:MAG: 2-C-methyl-D-erythritol 2,4-cyclodiphosphate synthase [Spirochaetes bacterium]|nr:2-C-methyl-D-erythritol 2,4-cyclodiphosphate synthase [Spirochaetota bacterium]